VTIPSQPLCCELTSISTGQLDVAKRIVRRSPLTLRRDGRAETTSMNSKPTCGLATTLPGGGPAVSAGRFSVAVPAVIGPAGPEHIGHTP
jgi:hypothetical protein